MTIKKTKKVSFNCNAPQIFIDPWRNADRLLEFVGFCVGCRSRVYSFADGENDPRGVLGERHALSTLDAGSGLTREHVACFLCMNEEDRYTHAIANAKVAEKREARKALRLELMSKLAKPHDP